MNSRNKLLTAFVLMILCASSMVMCCSYDSDASDDITGSGTPQDPYTRYYFSQFDYTGQQIFDLYRNLNGTYVLMGGTYGAYADIVDFDTNSNCTIKRSYAYYTSNSINFTAVGDASFTITYNTQPAKITVHVISEPFTPSHTVSFSSQGSVIHTQSVEEGSTATSYSPTLEGYTFGGWYTDTAFQTPFDFNTPINTDTTLYAKWIEKPVTITFYVEGEVHSTLQVPKGSVGVVYTPIMVEGIFAGWYYDSAMTQKYDATRSLDVDTNLYALGVPPLIFTSEPNASAVIAQVEYGTFFFDATESSGRYSILWDFGDGNTSTDPIAYNTYAEPGKYTVTLTITNIYGDSTTATYHVVYGENAAGGGGQ